MDDRPLGGGGSSYDVNWDEINESTDPFGSGTSKPPTCSTLKVTSQGDGPNGDTGSPSSTAKLTPKSKNSPAKLSRQSVVNSDLKAVNGTDGHVIVAAVSDSPDSSENKCLQEPTPPVPLETFPNSGPSAEEITAALERVALTTDANLDDLGSDGTESVPHSFKETPERPSSAHTGQNFNRVDSSTRPASPASSVFSRPLMSDSTVELTGMEGAVTEGEVLALRKERDDLVKTIDDMRRCIAEYDRSLRHLVEEKSQNQTQVNVSVADLIAERDQAVEEVGTIEKAFGDLHRRFEKSKQIIEAFKQNEEALKRRIDEFKSLLQRQETKYLALKKHAEDKLLKVTQDSEVLVQETEAKSSHLLATLRMLEVRNKSLESQLEQKQRENAELTKLCEELLSKYS